MSGPQSLRDLYSTPPDIWVFPQNNPSSSLTVDPSSSQWVPRNRNHSVLHLAPEPSTGEGSSVQANAVLKGLAASAFLQYTTAAIAMPWEVGKLLLQIQYIPRDTESEDREESHPPDQEEQEFSDSSTDSYFLEPGTHPHHSLRNPNTVQRSQAPSLQVEIATLEYVMPIGPADGVWGMMKRVGGWRTEGWFSLWKGLLTACVTDAISSAIQPVLHNCLISLLPSTNQSNLFLFPIMSHLLTGIILSPLDLVRTRLIAQSASAPHRTYSGPVDALSRILREEGGLKSAYFHPHLLLPAILDNTLRPFVTLSIPFLLGSSLGVSDDTNPVAWCCVEFLSGCIGLLFTLPVETVRRRLQVQVRGSATPLRTCVRTRGVPYHGVVDTLWSVFSEEKSSSNSDLVRGQIKKKKSRTKSQQREWWYYNKGIGQLYRGFGMGIGASAIVLVLSVVVGRSQTSSGWAEL